MTTTRQVSVSALAAAICLALCRPVEAGAAAAAPASRLAAAIRAAKGFLLKQITADGRCAGEPPSADPRYGGKTALCVHALLTAEVKETDEPRLQRAIQWLWSAKLHGTYAVSMRACAWSQLRDPHAVALLKKDVAWLIRAMGAEGRYTYGSLGGGAAETWDNSNAQMAVLGVWAGARRGVEVPPAYWRRVEKSWVDQQQVDGGWGYRINPRTLRMKTYGSMTAAGLASLYICFDNLHAGQFVRCSAVRERRPIAQALEWLGRNFQADENPGKGVEWYYYWLYCVARVGLASGHRYFGGHDWYGEGVKHLLAAQNPDGSWGYGDRVAETSFALAFLVRGRHPVLISKLRYGGKWNPRPRDAVNFARWVSQTFERPVSWQVVSLDAPVADWHEAPMLYVSGAGPAELTDAQLAKLRTFVQQGGTILTEAACNNGDFTLDVAKACRRMFPDYSLSRLPADHALYSSHFKIGSEKWLLGVSNGVRLLVVHAPREVSLAMQLGPRRAHLPIFRLMANAYLYVTDKGALLPRGSRRWPEAQEIQPRATIRLARLKHAGNCDPEPLAWRRMGMLLANRHRVRLVVSPPMDIGALDAAKWPIAHVTGTEAFTLTEQQAEALRRFLRQGGTLVVDAAGGAEAFADAARQQIPPLVPGGKRGRLAQEHPLYLAGPYEIRKVRYRRDYALSLADDRARPRLEVVLSGDRLAVILSREDLITGLLGIPVYGLRGYEPESAERLMTNILFHAAGLARSAAGPPTGRE